MGTVQNRVLQDRRRLSRLSVQLECRFKDSDKEYGALMLDLSQGGTLLSSTLLSPQETIPAPDNFPVREESIPKQESKVSITLESGGLKGPMTLKGTIKRSAIGMSEYGKVAQFGVEFEHTPLELLRLISTLSSRRRTSRFTAQIGCRFKSDDTDYAARILNMTTEGALLSSTFVPALNSNISMTLKTEEESLSFEATVASIPEGGEPGSFAVEFINAPPALARMLGAMSAGDRKKGNAD